MKLLINIYLILFLLNVGIILYRIYFFIFNDVLLNKQGEKLRKKIGEKNEKNIDNDNIYYSNYNRDDIF